MSPIYLFRAALKRYDHHMALIVTKIMTIKIHNRLITTDCSNNCCCYSDLVTDLVVSLGNIIFVWSDVRSSL